MAFTLECQAEGAPILAAALQYVLDQPSTWVVRITHGEEWQTVSGTIADLNIEGGMVTLADHDDEDRPTGAETVIDLGEISELEIY